MSEEIEAAIKEVQKTYGSALCRWGAIDLIKRLEQLGLIKVLK